MLSRHIRASVCCALCVMPVLAVQAQEIVPSHAFSAEELVALPTTNWITNGGNTFNQRYSPLTQINRYNVADLKAKWTTEMGSGDEFKNGGQTQILHFEGTLFISNGVNNVFAIDTESGNILWTYHGNPDPRSGNPIGWVSRGVAMGDGRIYLTTIDAHVIALNQQTGEEINGEPRKGVVQVGKTGWAYILDRVTGEPLIGIEERPVSQEPRQVTAATPSGPGPGGPPAMSPDLALQADLDNGSTIYDNACVACHGETGQGGQGGGPALTAELSLSQIMLVIHDGRNTMPGFAVFTDQELMDISTFVAERLKN